MPVDDSTIGETGKMSQPFIRQVFIEKSDNIVNEQAFERKLYVIRKRVEQMVSESELCGEETFYFCEICGTVWNDCVQLARYYYRIHGLNS